jgi:tetratricopeptide (TPR) repeat protein
VDDGELAAQTLQELTQNEANQQNPAVVWRIGRVRRNIDRYDQAREAFTRAVELNAQGLDYAWEAGSFWLDEAQTPQEMEWALESLKTVFVSSNDLYARTRYIVALIFAGRDQDAFNAAVQIAPDIMNDPDYYDILAYAAYRANTPEQARAWARVKIALMPDDVNDALYIDGLISWHVDGNLEAALQSFNAVIENREQSGDLIFNRRLRTNVGVDSAQVLAEMGRPDEALDRFNKVIEQINDYAPAFEARADLLLQMGQKEAARADLQRALELTDNPDDRQRLVERIVALGPAGSDG